jgi:hypothetical protein
MRFSLIPPLFDVLNIKNKKMNYFETYKIGELLIFVLVGFISVINWGIIEPSNGIVCSSIRYFFIEAFGALFEKEYRKK